MNSPLYTEETTLTDLTNKNIEYNRLIEQYSKKINVTSLFIEKKEFISQEKERIKNLFILPLEVKIGGDFKMAYEINFTEYVKQAYDLLSMGQNPKINQIITSAKTQHLRAKPSNYYFDEKEFSQAVFYSLVRGVAFIKYEKFLADEKKKIEDYNLKPSSPLKKPLSKRVWVWLVGTITFLGILAGLLDNSFNVFDRFREKESDNRIPQTDTTKLHDTTIIRQTFQNNEQDSFTGLSRTIKVKTSDTDQKQKINSPESFNKSEKTDFAVFAVTNEKKDNHLTSVFISWLKSNGVLSRSILQGPFIETANFNQILEGKTDVIKKAMVLQFADHACLIRNTISYRQSQLDKSILIAVSRYEIVVLEVSTGHVIDSLDETIKSSGISEEMAKQRAEEDFFKYLTKRRLIL